MTEVNSVTLRHRCQPLRDKQFLLTLVVGGERRNICLIHFEREHGGLRLFVHLPYFESSQGLLQKCRVVGPAGSTHNVDLAHVGVATTQKLKYVHHVDGETHFSQDKRALTTVRQRIAPLRQSRGHLFTLQYWGLHGFPCIQPRDSKKNRTVIGFELTGNEPLGAFAGRVVGHWYPRRDIMQERLLSVPYDPFIPLAWQTPQGETRPSLALAPKEVAAVDDFVLLLTYIPMPLREDPSQLPSLVFLGGFKAPGDSRLLDSTATFLALHYKDRGEEFADLEARLGSIDIAAIQPTTIANG